MTTPSRTIPPHRSTRRGSVYVLVLGASTLVAIVGIGAVALARSSIRATVSASDWSEAGLAAQSGVELAVAMMNSSSTWRSDLKPNKAYGPFAVGRALISFTLTDETDGDLTNNAADSVRIACVATVKDATRAYSALAIPAATSGYDALRCAIHAQGNITVSGNATITLGPLSSNSTTSNSAQLTSDIETSSLSSTGFIAGYVQSGVPDKAMPGNAGFTSLSSIATPIAYSATGGTIDRQILTPTLNTISSTTNASGVYSITVPILSTLRIRRSRLQACLLVTLSATSQLVVQDENCWDPPSATTPALIVQGSLLGSVTLSGSSTNAGLSEATTGMNFNPTGAPYNSLTDSDKLDTLPSELHGLYHIIGAIPLTLGTNLKTIGCVLTDGSVTLNTPAQLAAQPTLVSSPPTGYSDPVNTRMKISPGTYRWEVANVNPGS